MTLILVITLAALAVVAAAPAVRILDRKAGWPLAGLFLVGAVLLSRELPGVIDGRPLTFDRVWVPDVVAPGMDVSFALRGDALSLFFALLALISARWSSSTPPPTSRHAGGTRASTRS